MGFPGGANGKKKKKKQTRLPVHIQPLSHAVGQSVQEM